MHTRTHQSGFSIMEVLVVVLIIGFLTGLVVVGLGEWKERARRNATLARLQTLEAALDEYYEQLGRYPLLPPPGDTGPVDMAGFLAEVQRVGNIQDMLGGIRGSIGSSGEQSSQGENPAAVQSFETVVDGWNKEIRYVGDELSSGTPRTSTNQRPYFYSAGEDEDYGTADDLRSTSTQD